MAKAAKKQIKVKPKAKASQDTVKAVAFGAKIPAKKFKPGQRVKHTQHGYGEFKHYTSPTYEEAAVVFDKTTVHESHESHVSVALLSPVQRSKFKMNQGVVNKDGQIGFIVGYEYEYIRVRVDLVTNETQRWLSDECVDAKKHLTSLKQLKVKARPKASGSNPTAEQVLKRGHALKVGDSVRFSPTGDVGTIDSVKFVDENVSDQIRVGVKYANEEGLAWVGPTLLSKIVVPKKVKAGTDAKEAIEAATKMRFGDLTVFSPFIVADHTFVKVGNSTAVAAHVRGTTDEPFAMLATPAAQLSKDAKRSFKQADKVTPYSPAA